MAYTNREAHTEDIEETKEAVSEALEAAKAAQETADVASDAATENAEAIEKLTDDLASVESTADAAVKSVTGKDGITATTTDGDVTVTDEGGIAAARSAADTAQTTAEGAQSSADAAQTAADTAQSTAEDAATAAGKAQSDATQALSDAATARSAAEEASSKAEAARQTAETAQTTAEGAQTTADSVSSVAEAAEAKAEEALQAAETAAAGGITSVKGEDGVSASVSGNVATVSGSELQSGIEEATSAASAAQSAADTAQAAAEGAQATADTNAADITSLQDAVSALGNAVHFRGVYSSLDDVDDPAAGDMVIVDDGSDDLPEYVYDGTDWQKLGTVSEIPVTSVEGAEGITVTHDGTVYTVTDNGAIAKLQADVADLQERLAAIEPEMTVEEMEELWNINVDPVWDGTEYDLTDWLDYVSDGRVYGVSMKKDTSTECTKTRDNAGIAVPVPSTSTNKGYDPYEDLGPFSYLEVNGDVDDDGTPHVRAIRGYDEMFARDGSNGDVWILAPVLYVYFTEDDDTVELAISDTEQDGFELQAQATLPSGEQRPFMLYAKYGMGSYDGVPASVSGVSTTASVSHNNLITTVAEKGAGYSGRHIADDFYVKAMFLLKYATKNSQSYFYGVSNSSSYVSTGACDAVEGDGYPTASGTSEPYVIQGIEMSYGRREVMAGVVEYTDTDGLCYPAVVHDTSEDGTDVSGFTRCDVPMSESASTAYVYPLYPHYSNGFLYGAGEGASTSTGLCDRTYVYGGSSTLGHEWLSLGNYRHGDDAGLWSVHSTTLSYSDTNYGSRLSATGRGRG